MRYREKRDGQHSLVECGCRPVRYGEAWSRAEQCEALCPLAGQRYRAERFTPTQHRGTGAARGGRHPGARSCLHLCGGKRGGWGRAGRANAIKILM